MEQWLSFDSGIDTAMSCLMILVGLGALGLVVYLIAALIRGAYDWLDQAGVERKSVSGTIMAKRYVPEQSGVRLMPIVSTTHVNGQTSTSTMMVPMPYHNPEEFWVQAKTCHGPCELQFSAGAFALAAAGQGVRVQGVMGRFSHRFHAQALA